MLDARDVGVKERENENRRKCAWKLFVNEIGVSVTTGVLKGDDFNGLCCANNKRNRAAKQINQAHDLLFRSRVTSWRFI